MPGAANGMQKKQRRKKRLDFGSVVELATTVMENLTVKRKKMRKKIRSTKPPENETILASESIFVHFDRVQGSVGAENQACQSTFRAEEFASCGAVRASVEGSNLRKVIGAPPQESCITEAGSESGESATMSHGQDVVVGKPHNLSSNGDVKKGRKRKKKAIRENVEAEDQEVVKRNKTAEGERVWQYVCKRSVFVSPPAPRPEIPVIVDPPASALSPPKGRGNSSYSKRPYTNAHNFTGTTTRMEVNVNHRKVCLTLTREGAVAQEWIERQTGTSFGLDLEWQPNRRRGEKENKVALIQISTDTECLLVQMLYLDFIPNALVEFLKDPQRKIVGVGIQGDVQKLGRDYKILAQGAVDLCTLAVSVLKNDELRRAGLKALARFVLDFEMSKPKHITMSNWGRLHLDRRQVGYACMDAWVSHAIFVKLQQQISAPVAL